MKDQETSELCFSLKRESSQSSNGTIAQAEQLLCLGRRQYALEDNRGAVLPYGPQHGELYQVIQWLARELTNSPRGATPTHYRPRPAHRRNPPIELPIEGKSRAYTWDDAISSSKEWTIPTTDLFFFPAVNVP